jgi:hypothetical protein
MIKFVSYVPDEAIEKDAQALLAEYAHARGVLIEPPVAIEDIIEKHLKIGIEFDDTHGCSACHARASGPIPTFSARSFSRRSGS